MPICDGCGEPVDDNHIRQRIERLELATRFRPIHINVLLIDAAPPSGREDFFYHASSSLRARSPDGQAYLAQLTRLVGANVDADAPLEPILAEFQHRGFFLASAVECPMDGSDKLSAALRRLAPTVVRRVQFSYKPKFVALISEPTRELIEPLRSAGWDDRLVLQNGAPFAAPAVGRLPMEQTPLRARASVSFDDGLFATLSRFSGI